MAWVPNKAGNTPTDTPYSKVSRTAANETALATMTPLYPGERVVTSDEFYTYEGTDTIMGHWQLLEPDPNPEAAGDSLPLAGGVMTGSIDMTPPAVYMYNGKTLGYIVSGGVNPDNIFLGEAGNTTLTGANNIGIGPGAAASLTAAGFTTAVGVNSCHAVTSNGFNTAFGAGTLSAEASGGSNTAMGRNALGSQNGASNNCAIGYNTGVDVTTGGSNTLVGYNTGRGITTGSGNTVVGASMSGLAAGLTNAIILGSGGAAHYDYNNTTAGVHTFDAAVRLSKGYTVAALPAGVTGAHAYVTDGATSLAWGATVTGGGTTPYLVWYNGSAWTVVGK